MMESIVCSLSLGCRLMRKEQVDFTVTGLFFCVEAKVTS